MELSPVKLALNLNENPKAYKTSQHKYVNGDWLIENIIAKVHIATAKQFQ